MSQPPLTATDAIADPDPAEGVPADLRALPKVELHVHLEGSIPAATAAALAERHGEDPYQVLMLEAGSYPSPFRDFMHFVDTYLATSRQVRSPDDLATIAATFARQQAAQGIRYTEVTFTAVTHVDNGMEARAMWQALRDGFAEAPEVTIGLIVDAVRDLGVEHAERTVRLVGEADAPVVGLGLAGVEGSVPEAEFRLLREAADRLELGLAVHAGETGTPDNIRAALDDLGADRIGHGIAVVHDPDLLARVVREQVPFEICPSSNLALSIVPDLASHPVAGFWEAGLNLTINSDDPPFFATSLSRELNVMTSHLGLRRRDLAELQRRAARASFAPRQLQDRLVSEIDAWQAGPAL